MAMIKCKECGKEISDTAKACVNCGAPLKSDDFHKELNAAKRVAIAIIILLGLFAIFNIIYSIIISQ